MTSFKKLSLFAFALLAAATLHAQIEVTQLFMKGRSNTGLGGFLHAGFPVSKTGEISLEAGFDYFAPGQSHLIFIPLLAGYRHFFNRSGAGWYVEPFAGYTVGNTDIQRVDASGNPVINPSDSSEVDENPSGPTVGLSFGYIIPSPKYPVNVGLRFEHVFVSGDPSASLLALRVSWSLFAARRLQQQQ